ATADAFEDHGMIADQAVRAGIADAREVLARLATFNIDLDQVCAQLQDEGVGKFVVPFGKLIGSLDRKRAAVLADRSVDITVEPGAVVSTYKAQLGALSERGAGARLWARDATLWS